MRESKVRVSKVRESNVRESKARESKEGESKERESKERGSKERESDFIGQPEDEMTRGSARQSDSPQTEDHAAHGEQLMNQPRRQTWPRGLHLLD